MKKSDLYIVAMKYGIEKAKTGVTRAEVLQHLKKKGFEFGATDRDSRFDHLMGYIFSLNHESVCDEDRTQDRYYMTGEAYFQFGEYEELKSARNASLSATIFAIFAICISVYAAFNSARYSQLQLDSATEIVQSQFEKLDNSEVLTILNEILTTDQLILIETRNPTEAPE